MIEDSYPLSPMQQGMLFHSLYAPGSGVDIEQIVCTLNENLNVSAFEQAWQRVIERYPALRTSFRWEGLDQPIQEVHQHIRCPLEQQDWHNLSKRGQEAQLDAYLRTDRRRGFDLSKAPLMRLTLFQVGEADCQFIWTFHHALLDGRSFPLVLKEVFAFYEACCQGQDLQLGQSRPYRDYIEWLQQQDVSKAEAFWRQALKDFTTPTPLVIGKTVARSPDDEGDYSVQQIQLPKSLTSDLKSLTQRHQLTLNTLVQGAWALLLGRYSGEEDVAFGATRACRWSALEGVGTESMVGLFINTLPVRVHMPPEMPALTCLKELRMQSLAVREYEHTPLVKIQEWSDIPRGVPLFESILVFENYPLNSALQAQGGNWVNREFRLIEQTNYPLTLLGYGGTSLLLRLRYDRRRLADATISRMLGHLQTLLQGFVVNPGQRLSDVPLLTEAERHQLLVEWNNLKAAGNARTDYPRDRCIHQLFEVQVARTPEAVAVVFEDQQLTYQELNRRANQLAHHLRALGVGPEMLVGICVERSLEMVIGLLGILKAGGAYVPLDPTYPRERLTFMMEDAQVSVLLTQRQLVESLPTLGPQIVCLDSDWETIAQQTAENLANVVRADNLAYVLFTSGSTGLPKGVAVEHHSSVAMLAWARQIFMPDDLTGVLASTSICFDLSVFELFVPLSWGGKVILAENALHLPVLPAARQVTLINTVPSAMAELLRVGDIPPSVRVVNLAGEPLRTELVQQVYQRSRAQRVFDLYGPSEDTTYSTFALRSSDGPATIGRPIANTQIYLLNTHLDPVPIDVPGELYIGGAGLARGYLNRPELTAERFVPNPFSNKPGARLYKTGDLARYLTDGNIEFLRRIDHQVKIRGFRIELGEIEAVLGQHPTVQETVVVAREDTPGDKRIVAYVVTDQEPSPSVSELRRFLQEKLPDYMLPSAFVMLEALPLTPNGKIDRRALPAPDTSRRELEEGFVPPRTPTEKTLADIWAEILGLEKVGVYDDFFKLGGHSLLATRVISRLREAFRVDLPLRSLFEAPTLTSLAERIETIRWATQGLQALSRAKMGDREEIVL